MALTPIVVLGFFGTELNGQILAARVLFTTAGVALATLAHVALWPTDVDQLPTAPIDEDSLGLEHAGQTFPS